MIAAALAAVGKPLKNIASRNDSRRNAAHALEWIARGIINRSIVKRLPLDATNDGWAMVRDGTADGRFVVNVENSA